MTSDRAPPDAGFIHAPFSSEQVDTLNKFQRLGYVHEFTCPENHGGADRTLYATREGWRCPHCAYQQDWAHEGMLYVRPLETIVTLPCDVMLPPATVIHKGCEYSALFEAFKARAERPAEQNRFANPVQPLLDLPSELTLSVQSEDYSYVGRLAGLAWKRTGKLRYVVEDDNGRLFIQSARQIGKAEGWTP